MKQSDFSALCLQAAVKWIGVRGLSQKNVNSILNSNP